LLERHGVKAKVFGNDVKVYSEINDPNDSEFLQNSLAIICNWANE